MQIRRFNISELMNDLSLDDGSSKHIVSKQNDPNDLSKYPYELDYYPNDNMTSGKIQILSKIRNFFSLNEVEHIKIEYQIKVFWHYRSIWT